MPVSESEMIVSSKDYLLTETVLNPKMTVTEVEKFIREWKTTGHVRWTTLEGGVRGVSVEERTKLSEDQADQVREFLGFEEEKITE